MTYAVLCFTGYKMRCTACMCFNSTRRTKTTTASAVATSSKSYSRALSLIKSTLWSRVECFKVLSKSVHYFQTKRQTLLESSELSKHQYIHT